MNKIFFIFKYFLFRKSALEAYKAAKKFEFLPVSNKKEIVFKLKKKLLLDAYNNTIFYRNFFDQMGFDPCKLKCEQDWEKVPVLEKHMIRNNVSKIIAKNSVHNKLKVATTGGSTGMPLKVYKDKSVPVEILGWRALQWWGLHQYNNHGVVNRSVLTTKTKQFVNNLIWWPTKRIFLDASTVNENKIENFVELIDKKKIKYLVGYCGSLEKIADYVIENKIIIKDLSLIWSTTSPLVDSVRKKMEKAFNCQIMDQYGSIEVFHIAVQKPGENFLTVNTDYVHVDIVNSRNKVINEVGEYGDVLVTDLYSNKFPIIKYRLGDKSRIVFTMDNSPDGFPKIDFVRGRISDIISFKDGSYLDGAFLTTICDGFDDVISSYQIFQNINYKVFLKLVLQPDVSIINARVQTVISKLSNLVEKKSDFEAVQVDSIPDDRGKRRFIISDIKYH